MDISSIADFACGRGSLLRAARRRWPEAALYANDIDAAAVKYTARCLAVRRAANVDFLENGMSCWGAQKFSLVLLNPPFSQMAGKLYSPSAPFELLKCSRAMAFLISATEYLEANGQLVAILPASCLTSKLDHEARTTLAKHFGFDVIMRPAEGYFEGADVSVCAVRLTNLRGPILIASESQFFEVPWQIARGTISVTRSQRVESATGWIHTTSLGNGRVIRRYKFPPKQKLRFTEPGSLLVPRVGTAALDKIVLLSPNQREVLSDCVFSVSCKDRSILEALHQTMITSFDELAALYSGTGAPYLTVSALNGFLSRKELEQRSPKFWQNFSLRAFLARSSTTKKPKETSTFFNR